MSDRIIERGRGGSKSGSVSPVASESFVLSPRVERLTDRAMAYLALGYPVHLSGPPGTGKTTLAFHIAAQLGRPVSLMHGNDDFGSGDLIGKDSGYTKSTVIDNYISSVLKTNEDLSVKWCDNRLTTACQQGHTLIYDEFNRTRPEANNILLSILEEGVLNLPRSGGEYLVVHPAFRVIFTSNPDEFAGVHKAPDALQDRLITIHVDHESIQTQADIAHAKSGLDALDCLRIAQIAHTLRERAGAGHRPTLRSCIALASMLASTGRRLDASDAFVLDVAWDVLGSPCNAGNGPGVTREDIRGLIENLSMPIADESAEPARAFRAKRAA